MEDNVAPCVQDAEVEGFRRNLATSDARDDFYEPITHPFPADPTPEPDDLKVEQLKEQGLTCDVPTRVPPPQGHVEETTPTPAVTAEQPEPKRSISQEIIDVAYRTAQEVTSAAPVERVASAETTALEIDVIKDASTKSLFNSLITSPSRVSSRMSRRGSSDTPAPLRTTEVDEGLGGRGSVTLHKEAERPRYYSSRATTLPAKLECKMLDPASHQKLTRWEVFKRKFYLGAAHNLPPSRAVDAGVGGALEADSPRASTAGPIDMDSFCEVTNIEGLDLEGIPPMTQRSRKLFSWTRLKTGLTGLKRRAGKEAKSDDDGPKGEPDEAVAHDAEDEEDDEEGVCSQDEGAATSAKTAAKDKSHSWFEILSHRLFTATRRQRVVDDAPARPATAHTQQYYEIESNW